MKFIILCLLLQTGLMAGAFFFVGVGSGAAHINRKVPPAVSTTHATAFRATTAILLDSWLIPSSFLDAYGMPKSTTLINAVDFAEGFSLIPALPPACVSRTA